MVMIDLFPHTTGRTETAVDQVGRTALQMLAFYPLVPRGDGGAAAKRNPIEIRTIPRVSGRFMHEEADSGGLFTDMDLHFVIPAQDARNDDELYHKCRLNAVFCSCRTHDLARYPFPVFLCTIGAQVFSPGQYP